jgi:hypothetical protein
MLKRNPEPFLTIHITAKPAPDMRRKTYIVYTGSNTGHHKYSFPSYNQALKFAKDKAKDFAERNGFGVRILDTVKG